MAAGTHDIGAARLDAFVDAAFAFALTLLVIGSSRAPESYAELIDAVRDVPAFMIGFALVGMFWHGHVRWRRHGGVGGSLASVFLSFALVFLVLVYVYPLRLMAVSLVEYLAGTPAIIATREQLAGLFAIYGLGFAAMATTMLLLFVDGRRRAPDASREAMTVEIHIWGMLIAAGLVSTVVTRIPAIAAYAGFAYAPLGLVIPLYAMWSARRAER